MKLHRRLVARVAALIMGLTAATVGLVAAPPAAYAASCQTDAHVYFIYYGSLYVKTEYDPVDGGTYDFHLYYNTSYTFQLGGNGIEPSTTPRWEAFRPDNGYVGSNESSTASGNCVSNQKSFSVSAGPGEVFTYKANYVKGNHDGEVRGQAHFRLFFDTAPPVSDPDPDPNDPCPGVRICPIEY
ncbi:hypothetical protein HDA40_007700 [Hamadaea flava]|uniref:Secreted protein n=1 Tax=Hamadaea flava TaxID=1742688 RepID=A0ABV8LVX3_9ACTN|nr:hypothetical protein [Hamadaea flava]MCP2329193.1 hypothetical protein [Hamadaea flava]